MNNEQLWLQCRALRELVQSTVNAPMARELKPAVS